jgi:hypothetical protein
VGKFITNFATESAYNSAVSSLFRPNVALEKGTNTVHYNKRNANQS